MKTPIAVLLFSLSAALFAQKQFTQTGIASFYGDNYEGNYTSSGEKYAHNKYTAAHLTLPIGTKVEVTNHMNGKTVVVRINDRGPFIKGRIIDLSQAAAAQIGITETGTARVKIETTDEEPPPPSVFKKPVVKVTPYETVEETDTSSEEITTGEVIEDPSRKGSQASTEIFRVNVTSEPFVSGSEYFGLQVGSYKESANFLRKINEIKTQTDEDIYVIALNKGSEKVYKIVIGKYPKRRDAERLKKDLRTEFSGSFIFTYK